MRVLLDTHVLLWWLLADKRLSTPARNVIAEAENEVLISPVSAMEIATKHRLGKLPEAATLAIDFREIIAAQSFSELPLSIDQARLAGTLPGEHRDPFDRLLAAQCLVEDLALVSGDVAFDEFGVRRLWSGT